MATKKKIKTDIPEKENQIGKVINCDKLRVRKEASAASEIIGFLNRKENVTILGSSRNKLFYKISSSSGLEGYCLKTFIEKVN